MLSTIMSKNPPIEVCTQAFCDDPELEFFIWKKKSIYGARQCLTLCAGSREEKQWEENSMGIWKAQKGKNARKYMCIHLESV